MGADWRNLRMGDRIRFLLMPPAFSRPNYHVPRETLALYELLISTGEPLEIDDFLDDGSPIGGYIDGRKADNPVFHGLLIDDTDEGCWERVTESS